jgi:hypothetical protein
MTSPVQPTSPAGAAGPPTVPAGTLVPVTHLKAGYKTTEFWVAVLTDLGLILASSTTSLAPRYAALGAAISSGLYAVARGLAKLNPPKDATL